MALTELRSQYLEENLSFLDRQKILCPSVNEQIGFDFQGFRRSYFNDEQHPDSKTLAQFGRIWIYDVSLSIFADLKAGRIRSAGYQAGRVLQLGLKESEKGFQGLWHFSYNTQGDSFIDPRGPLGANCWCLNALYAFVLSTGNTAALEWMNQAVYRYLFSQQITEPSDPRYGLVRAGLYNPEDVARQEAMGYRVFEGNPNIPYEHTILEHSIDAAGTFRLAFRATKRFAPNRKQFLEELIHRHDLVMRAVRRCFWQGDHFVSAMDEQGKFFLGTDGTPSIAVDNNTWAAHVFLPYDLELAKASIRYVESHFLTHVPPALLEDVVEGSDGAGLRGLYYFTAAFSDPFVQVPAEHRKKMECLLQPEATFGLILFLHDAAASVKDPKEKNLFRSQAQELYEQMVRMLRLYGPGGAPYASANVPTAFSTLHAVTTAATGCIVTSILQNGAPGDFVGILPPAEFLVDGKPPFLQSQ